MLFVLMENRVLLERSNAMKSLRSLVVVMAVLGIVAFAYLSFGAADEWANIEQQIRDAKTPADHQALAAFYAKEAQTAHQLHNKELIMRDAYAASRTMQEKGRPTEHCTVLADKYRDVAKEYEALAAMHKTMAEQLK
jgi:hypothetical protein